MDSYFLPKNGLARCYLRNTLSYSDSFFQNQLWKKFHFIYKWLFNYAPIAKRQSSDRITKNIIANPEKARALNLYFKEVRLERGPMRPLSILWLLADSSREWCFLCSLTFLSQTELLVHSTAHSVSLDTSIQRARKKRAFHSSSRFGRDTTDSVHGARQQNWFAIHERITNWANVPAAFTLMQMNKDVKSN